MADQRGKVLRALRDVAGCEPVRMRVAGDCMAPLARHRALIEVSAARVYWPGDVLAFQSLAGGLLLHRLIGYRPRGFSLRLVTQGDSCSACDAPVGWDRVIGKVTGGECAQSLARVPLTARLRAMARFCFLVLARAKTKLVPFQLDAPKQDVRQRYHR